MVSSSASAALRLLAPLRLVLLVCGVLAGLLSLNAQTAEEIIRFPDLDTPRVYTGLDQPLAVEIDDAYAAISLTYNGSKTKLPLNAGSYTIKVTARETSPAAGQKPRSFTRSAKFTIAKTPLVVTADDAGRILGVANPKFTFTYEGFVNGETETAIKSKPSGKTTAKTSSPVGQYPIEPVGGSATNYEFTGRVAGTLTVVSFASGTHEALLYDSFLGPPVGKLTLTLPASGVGYSGKLDLGDEETAIFSFKGKLVLSDDYRLATSTAVVQRSPKTKPATTPYRYLVNISLNDSGGVALTLEKSTSPYTSAFAYQEVADIGRVAVHKKTSNPATTHPAPWAGTHTLSLLDPTPVIFNLDTFGAGYATAVVGTDGKLTLKGKLADGTTLTASLLSDADGGYRVFRRVYGARLESDFAGFVQLVPHPDLAGRYYSPRNLESGSELYWRKAAKEGDKTYPDGISTLYFNFALDPWLPPAAAKKATKTTEAIDAITLAQRLLLTGDNTAEVAFSVGYDFSSYGDLDFELPRTNGALLSAKGKVVPNLLENPTKWKVSFNASTGVFTGSFILVDEPFGSSKVTRKVVFQGILRQPPANDIPLEFGAGFFMLSPLESDFFTTPISQKISFAYPE